MKKILKISLLSCLFFGALSAQNGLVFGWNENNGLVSYRDGRVVHVVTYEDFLKDGHAMDSKIRSALELQYKKENGLLDHLVDDRVQHLYDEHIANTQIARDIGNSTIQSYWEKNAIDDGQIRELIKKSAQLDFNPKDIIEGPIYETNSGFYYIINAENVYKELGIDKAKSKGYYGSKWAQSSHIKLFFSLMNLNPATGTRDQDPRRNKRYMKLSSVYPILYNRPTNN